MLALQVFCESFPSDLEDAERYVWAVKYNDHIVYILRVNAVEEYYYYGYVNGDWEMLDPGITESGDGYLITYISEDGAVYYEELSSVYPEPTFLATTT